MLFVTFETVNAAFEEDERGECARILKSIARHLEAGTESGRITDANGNKIGAWQFTTDHDAPAETDDESNPEAEAADWRYERNRDYEKDEFPRYPSED